MDLVAPLIGRIFFTLLVPWFIFIEFLLTFICTLLASKLEGSEICCFDVVASLLSFLNCKSCNICELLNNHLLVTEGLSLSFLRVIAPAVNKRVALQIGYIGSTTASAFLVPFHMA